jgi:hypothetical protein
LESASAKGTAKERFEMFDEGQGWHGFPEGIQQAVKKGEQSD